MKHFTPSRAIELASSTEVRLVSFSQPCVETCPSRASILTIMESVKRRQTSSTNSGSSTAAVPRITRSIPIMNTCSIVSRLRMPPPSWVGTRATLAMARMASRLRGSPAAAPSRSTIWSRGAPADCHFRATSNGSSENLVSWL